nr:hypothetical protein [Tanacetum cinerariifolium]
SQQAATKNRGKVIVNSPQPIYDQEPSMVAEDDETSKDKEIDKLMALISLSFKKIYKPTNNNLRTSSKTSRANQDNTPMINRSTRDDIDDELEDQELEAHYMYMAQLQEVSLDAADFGPVFDIEPVQKVSTDDHYNVFAIESEHPEQSESIHDTYPIEQDEHNVIIDSLDMSYDREQIDQNDDDDHLVNEQKLCAHQETISILSQQKEAQIKLYKTREDKELDKLIALENKVKVLDNIVYKTGQSVQTMNMLNNKYRTSFAKPEFLKKAQRANPHMYDIDEVTNLQCDYLELLEKCECLEKELSKSKMMSKSFEALQKQTINLEIDLQQYLKAQLQDKGIVISELKKLIAKLKRKSVDTKFEKSSVIRQPNAFKSQRPSILGKPTIFSDSLERKDFSKSKSVTQINVSNDFSKLVTAQTLPLTKKSILNNMNVLAPGMYKLHTEPTQARTSQLPQDSRKTNKRVSFSTSRPQLKSNQIEDRVLRNNSQGKKHDVEDHRRNVKFSKNKASVTACNDSLEAKTLNVNFVCATCGKCMLNEKHDMCVLKSINGVNSRTKMPIAMPVSTREPKCTVKQSVDKPLKKTVASESNQKPRNITRKLYERVSKACSWWYPKFTPLGYKWKPKSKKENVNPNLVEIVLFIIDSGCSKHMTGNLKLLINFVEKFLGLNHNLFSVGQFCDADLEVAFQKSTCYIRDLKGNDILTGSRGTDLYLITLQDTNCPNPICLMAKAISSQAWLWHHRLSHLNFDTINLLSKNDIVVVKMSRDVLTVGSTMRIPLLYRGEYSQWVERFMNYLKEQTDGEAMINSIKNGDQPFPRVTQVSIARTT